MPTSLADALNSTGMSGADLKAPGNATPDKLVKPDPKPASEMDVLKQGQGKVDDAIKEMEAVKPPGFPTLDKPPEPETKNDPMKGYVSAIGVLGAIGSMFTRRPMVNSMNAAAAAVTAMNAGDEATFKKKFDIWKIENDNSFKLLDYQTKIYDDIMKAKGKTVDERMAELGAQAAAFHDDYMGDLARKRLDLEASDHNLKVQEAAQKAQKLSMEINDAAEKRALYNEDVEAHPEWGPEQKLLAHSKIFEPSVMAASIRAEENIDKEKRKLLPQTIDKTESFGFTNSVTKANSDENKAVDTEARKKERNVPVYADRIMSSLEAVKPQIDKFPTGANGGMRSYLMKGANLVSFGQMYPTVATAGDLIDKNLYNVVLDYTNLVQNTGMRGSNLQLQTNIKGKPGPELTRNANKSIIAEIEGNTEDVRLRYVANNKFREANPLGYADERAGEIYEALKAKYPLLSHKPDGHGNTLMYFHPENVKKIKELLPDAIAHPEKYNVGGGLVAAGDEPPMEGAKKADDGNWYLPDPARPWKYLQVGE